MAGGLTELLSVQESALKLREMRQELLASNIANADTPNYKARDINFSAALKQLTGASASGSGTTLALTASASSSSPAANLTGGPGSAGNALGVPVLYRNDRQGSIDGNNVDTDQERNQFADNGLHYEATVTLITSQIHNMLAVLQG